MCQLRPQVDTWPRQRKFKRSTHTTSSSPFFRPEQEKEIDNHENICFRKRPPTIYLREMKWQNWNKLFLNTQHCGYFVQLDHSIVWLKTAPQPESVEDFFTEHTQNQSNKSWRTLEISDTSQHVFCEGTLWWQKTDELQNCFWTFQHTLPGRRHSCIIYVLFTTLMWFFLTNFIHSNLTLNSNFQFLIDVLVTKFTIWLIRHNSFYDGTIVKTSFYFWNFWTLLSCSRYS